MGKQEEEPGTPVWKGERGKLGTKISGYVYFFICFLFSLKHEAFEKNPVVFSLLYFWNNVNTTLLSPRYNLAAGRLRCNGATRAISPRLLGRPSVGEHRPCATLL